MDKSVLKYIMGVVIAACVVLFCWYFIDIIAYILISVIVAFVGRPIVDLLGKVKIGDWSRRRREASRGALSQAALQH